MGDSKPDETGPTAGDTPLPHDRDERSAKSEAERPSHHNRAPIAQAHRDVEAGLQDTERIGTPTDIPAKGRPGSPEERR